MVQQNPYDPRVVQRDVDVVEMTYFRFQGKFYEQTYGMFTELTLSPGLSNLFMEEFEKALAEAPHPCKFWGRYVDETGVVTKKIYDDELFQHINKQHPRIKFPIEKEAEDHSLPMLDLRLKREGNSMTTDI